MSCDILGCQAQGVLLDVSPHQKAYLCQEHAELLAIEQQASLIGEQVAISIRKAERKRISAAVVGLGLSAYDTNRVLIVVNDLESEYGTGA